MLRQTTTEGQMQAERALLEMIGRMVELCGHDRVATLAQLEQALGEPLTDDHLELVAEFSAGLQQPERTPIDDAGGQQRQ